MVNPIPSRTSLDGVWRVKCDRGDEGLSLGWADGLPGGGDFDLQVPGNLRAAPEDATGVVWYQRTFSLPDTLSGKRVWLTFGAAGYKSTVFVNGVGIGGGEGHQSMFTLEATQAARAGENLLCLRVTNPGTNPADGLRGSDLLGSGNGGGLYMPVSLGLTGPLVINDLYVTADPATGLIEARVEADGPAGRCEADATDGGGGMQKTFCAASARLDAGRSCVTLELPVEGARLWSPEEPNLYNVNLRLYDADGNLSDCRRLRTGFRELRVEKGYFMLNGRRILLKCAHGGTHTPFTTVADPRNTALNKLDVTAMKAAGFNCIRYLQGHMNTDVLDLCDELGLMVYQEHASSWQPGSLPFVHEWEASQPDGEIERRFYNDLLGRIKCDRSHPSVVIWGLLNETPAGRRYAAATAALDRVRDLDETRLVLLSSGSWDGDLSIGSVCNPRSRAWECQWGDEGTGKVSRYLFEDEAGGWRGSDKPGDMAQAGYFTGSGDVHIYPPAMTDNKMFDWFEALGQGDKPVFLSEYGAGSQFDYPSLRRFMESIEDAPDNALVAARAIKNEKALKDFIAEYGLGDMYPEPRDYLLDSYAEQARCRDTGFSMVRANPRIAGFSMTAVLDHGFAGEGFLGFLGEFKPGHMDVMQDGWAPLRWCLLTEPTHIYAGQPVRLRAHLANENVLAAGDYPVTLRIYNDRGVLWSRALTAHIAPDADGVLPTAVTVLDETLVIDGLESGEWTFAADLERGGFARAGKVRFFVSEHPALPELPGRIYTAGALPEAACELLVAQGARLRPLPDAPVDHEVILVGKTNDAEEWKSIYRHIACGAAAVFLDCWSLTAAGEKPACMNELLPADRLLRESGTGGYLMNNWDWLYHKTPIGLGGELFEGLPGRRMLDQYYYNQVLAFPYFGDIERPDRTAAVSFAMGVYAPGGVDIIKGVMLAGNDFFNGSYIFGTLDVADNIGHPAADRLLVNYVLAAQGHAGALAPLPEKAAQLIDSAIV